MEAECPDFDANDYDKILKWADAKVAYADTFVDGHGHTTANPKLAHWALHWKHGFIGFDGINSVDDEDTARMAAALFIYLWKHGIMASLADSISQMYAIKCKEWRKFMSTR